MTKHMRVFAAAVVTATTAAALIPTTATAAPPGTTPDGPADYEITLITGDHAQASRGADGQWSVSARPDETTQRDSYLTYGKRRGNTTDVYLVPRKATKLIQSGVLDQELFNITGLIRQGYDDAHSKSIPLLVQGSGPALAAPTAAKVRRQLTGTDLVALDATKSEAETFWAGLDRPDAFAKQDRRIWLNARVAASLDRSVPQIGAPAAWQAGFTGQGVTVAVLDTGYDATHPDLAGKVVQSKDFTGSGSVQDHAGHGTHVASTIAGSGAASDGKYKGAAPGVTLAVGRVLDDNGGGSMDGVIEGMRWAAADVHAKVVNMSLGGNLPNDGTDPVAQTVNELSARYGTLFVVAAGNDGRDRTVDSPASADAALAVGSVTKDGAVSEFSSRGPRVRDGAVKPEIAAPGSDIVAAKAKDATIGDPVDEHYSRLSGTSMATPHVAGAAAIMAQQHPDWSGDRIKAALVGSAKSVADAGVFTVGGGLVDLARATTQPVTATPATANAFLPWPSTTPQQRTITYHNDGAAPVTLNLELALTGTDGAPAPAGLVRPASPTVTVPAHGTADTVLTMTPRSGKADSYGGLLVAQTADGTAIRTPVGVTEEPESYQLALDVKDRNGAPADLGGLTLISIDTGEVLTLDPRAPMRVVAGTYAVETWADTPRPGREPVTTVFAHPGVRVDKDTTVAFDARAAKRVSVSTDRPDARSGWLQTRFRVKTDKMAFPFDVKDLFNPQFNEVYAYSPPGVTAPWFSFAVNARLQQAPVELFTDGPRGFEATAIWLSDAHRADLCERLALAYVGDGGPDALRGVDLRGKLAVLAPTREMSPDDLYARIADLKNAGAKVVGVVRTKRISTPEGDPAPALPTVLLAGGTTQAFVDAAKSGSWARLTTRRNSDVAYDLSYPSEGRVAESLTYRARRADLASVRMVYRLGTETSPPRMQAWVAGLGGKLGVDWPLAAIPRGERVEYYTPGDWRFEVRSGSEVLRRQQVLRRGWTYRLIWCEPVGE
ncbi:S8 family peptidase [Actinokineospora enzanensis]|uniref:S8 family peptidase n=1 Tax=Actinokineospora enzanensis TaxID=155975 RepID=UPI000376ACD5|nr:S8 family serine peptidase [Actinokineospora enzanensis]